ncbi:MAG: hypothetical protein H6585_10780 [Flavobacteriales bacterium]|nr:hypothetical protein [Flavobacteriales bacterium]MCB9448817.1 hypothetical protein [Flavobacteriales bacterium]
MTSQELAYYMYRVCRFKLKSGKEVYGVIWEDKNLRGEREYFFSSPGDFRHYLRSRPVKGTAALEELRYRLDLSELVGGEVLEELRA